MNLKWLSQTYPGEKISKTSTSRRLCISSFTLIKKKAKERKKETINSLMVKKIGTKKRRKKRKKRKKLEKDRKQILFSFTRVWNLPCAWTKTVSAHPCLGRYCSWPLARRAWSVIFLREVRIQNGQKLMFSRLKRRVRSICFASTVIEW